MTTTTERAIERFQAAAAAEGLLDVAYATTDSPFGTLLLAQTPRGLVRIGLPNQDSEELLTELATKVSPRVLEAPARGRGEGRRRSPALASASVGGMGWDGSSFGRGSAGSAPRAQTAGGRA